MSPAVSIVLATRNRRPLLEEAVASVRAQTLSDLELLIVDDASTDDTVDWVESLDDGRIRLLRLEARAGQIAAANTGLAEAGAPLTLFFDDDDLLRSDALALLRAALEPHPDVVAAVGARSRFGEGIAGGRINHPTRPRTLRPWREVIAGWSACTAQVLARTGAIREIGGFRTDVWPLHDRYLVFDLARRGPLAFIPETVFDYRVHDQVRPADIVAIRERGFASMADEVPPAQRRPAQRALRAGHLVRHAEEDAAAGRVAGAVAGYARAALAAPELARSPLQWPALAHGAVAAVGRRR